MHSHMWALVPIASLLAAQFAMAASEAPENSVARVSVIGVAVKNDSSLQSCRRVGTGFLISHNNYALTARHLFQVLNLNDQDQCGGRGVSRAELLTDQLTIKFGFGPQSITDHPSFVARRYPEGNFTSEVLDSDGALLLLESRPPNTEPFKLCMEDSPTIRYEVEVLGYFSQHDRILRRSGTWDGYSTGGRWLLNISGITNARGISGSPVINKNGDVVAIFTGAESGATPNVYFATPITQIKELAERAPVPTIEKCEKIRPYGDRILDKWGGRRPPLIDDNDFLVGRQFASLNEDVVDSFGHSNSWRFDLRWNLVTAGTALAEADAPTINVIRMKHANGAQMDAASMSPLFAEAILESTGLSKSQPVNEGDWILVRNTSDHFALIQVNEIGEAVPNSEPAYVVYTYWIRKKARSVDFSAIRSYDLNALIKSTTNDK